VQNCDLITKKLVPLFIFNWGEKWIIGLILQKNSQHMQKTISIAAMAGIIAVLAIPASSAFAATTPTFGMLYYEGEIVKTVIPPSEAKKGLDDLYAVTNGIEGQLAIAAVAPGDKDYHGGQWTVSEVTFNDDIEPYSLTSEESVLDAEAAGDITITRDVAAFLCPIQR